MWEAWLYMSMYTNPLDSILWQTAVILCWVISERCCPAFGIRTENCHVDAINLTKKSQKDCSCPSLSLVNPPMHVLLCDPWCGSERNSLEMQSVAFFTFSTHSLQLPFSQHNLEAEYQRGSYTTSDPHSKVSLAGGQGCYDVYAYWEDTLCTCCAKYVACKLNIM